MNLINSLYVSSQIPLIVLLISLTIAIMTVNTFRYGEILMVANIGALYYSYHTRNTLLNQPVSQNFVVKKQKDYLSLKSKNSHFESAIVKIVDEDNEKYTVEYEGDLRTVDK